MEYGIYYIFVFAILAIPNGRVAAISFTTCWLIFVGLRFENGVDWFTTLEMFSRTIVASDDFLSIFQNYDLVDSEIFYKILAKIFLELSFDNIWFFFSIALLESIIIFKLISSSYNSKLTILVIASLFTIHFGFNAVRQGFALILYVAAIRFSNERSSNFYIWGAITTHWASLPLITIDFFSRKIKTSIKSGLIFGLILFLIIFISSKYFPLELIESRFSGSSMQYDRSGLGLKFIFSAICTTFAIYKIRPKNFKSIISIEIVLFMAAITFPPLMRYFLFYTYFLIIYLSTIKINTVNIKLFLGAFALILALFEWQEVSRFNGCENCGYWLPYKSILFQESKTL